MEIPDQQLSNLREIYRDPTGKTLVFFGDYTQPSGNTIPVAVKKIRCTGLHESYIYYEECSNQMRISVTNVCQIYGWNMSPDLVTIVMERLDNDLAKEIAMRREQVFPYTEVELLRLLWDVVSVFTEMQVLSISHNDIKAENIFVLKRNGSIIYKVGDFGSAGTVRSLVNGLKGTPLYLSPILKREYRKASYGGPTRQDIYHSPVKSDVFSLGVTLIYAAELQPPNDLLDESSLEWKLNSHVNRIKVNNPIIAWVLEKMLIVDETRRCDFKDIRNSLLKCDPLRDYVRLNPETPSFHKRITTMGQDYINLLNTALEGGDWTTVESTLEIIEGKGWLKVLLPEAQWGTSKCLHCLGSVPAYSKTCENCHIPNGKAV